MDRTIITRIDALKNRTEYMDDLLECLADVAASGQPNMISSLFGALRLTRGINRQFTEELDDLSRGLKTADVGSHTADKANDCRMNVGKAITNSLNNIDTGMSAARRKTLFDLDAELLDARVYIERAEAMLAEVCEEYFSDIREFNPDTPQGKENIIGGFNQNRIVAEIAHDYALQTRQTLDGMVAMFRSNTENAAALKG